MSASRFPDLESFDQFWPFYVGEHRKVGCRALHYIGALAAVGILGWGLVSANWLAVPLALVVGYAFAWTGHFFVEHNVPATWGYVGWSLRAELKMARLALTGRMSREVARLHGDDPQRPGSP